MNSRKMKINFKHFTQNQQLNEGSDYGIPHLEDLDIETFIRSVEKIHELEAVQKLDGANLRVGIDERGELFTSREQKGGRRFYSLKDFPKNSAYDGFKAAHAVLEKAEGYISEVLQKGETINLEIIYGSQPNTVYYGKDNINYIALLEILPGDDPSVEVDQSKIDQILKMVKGKIFVVKTLFSDTTDGANIMRAPLVTDWKFIKSDIVSPDDIKDVDIIKEVGSLKAFLKTENAIAKKLGKDLTNFELLKDKSHELSDERNSVNEKILTDFKLPIKEKFLKLISRQKPSIRGDVEEEGSYEGIEGLIFYDKSTREKFKIVDKDVFTAINKFNYQSRKSIATKITTNDVEMPIESRGGIVGEAKIRTIKLFGIPGLELPSQAKKTIEKFKGENRQDSIEMIVKSMNQLNFTAIKRKIQAIYISALDDLEESLNSFKENSETYELELKNGKKIKYTKEIKRRTLMVYAEARRQIIEIINDVKRSDDFEDLIEIFLSSQLDSLYGDE
jgi:hypothetical protein